MTIPRRSFLGLAATGVFVPHQLVRAEPITAAAAAALVGAKLLEGALQYAGGQILANALGQAKITDVRTWIAVAIAQIQTLVREELRRQLTQLVLDEMEADLQGVISHVNQYALLLPDNQATNRAILESVNNTTAAAIPRVSKYDQASPIIAGFMAYRLIVRNGLFLLDKDPGHIRGMRPDMDAYVKIMQGIVERNLPSLEVAARLKFLGCRALPPSEGTKNQAACRYAIDGVEVEPYTDPPRYTNNMIEAKMRASLQSERDLFVAQINSYLGNATSAFGAMCKKIGDNYPVVGIPSAFTKALPLAARTARFIMAPGVLISPR